MGLSDLLIILWALLASHYMIEYAPLCKDISFGARCIVCLVLLIGAPIFSLGNLLETILDCVMPDDWHNDEDGGFGI